MRKQPGFMDRGGFEAEPFRWPPVWLVRPAEIVIVLEDGLIVGVPVGERSGPLHVHADVARIHLFLGNCY